MNLTNLSDFNANNVEPAGAFEAIPAGLYLATIIASEEKATKAGTGHYLQFTFQVLEGDHKSRLLWARLNLDNPNDRAVQIAKGELSAICRAVDVMQPQDSADLHNIPLAIKVTQRTWEGATQNEIKAYFPSEKLSAATPGERFPWEPNK